MRSISKLFSWKSKEKPIETFYVRFSGEEDIDKIFDYYNLNEHQSIKPRDRKILEDLISSGAVTVVEAESGEIIASTVSYPGIIKEKDIEQTCWQEVESIRITKKNGYKGLFGAMAGAQVFRALMVDEPRDYFVGRMLNRPVQMLAEDLGWKPLDDSDVSDEMASALAGSVGRQGTDGMRPKDHWYYCGRDGVFVMLERLNKVLNDPILKHHKFAENGEKIRISYERSPLIMAYKPHLESLIQLGHKQTDHDEYAEQHLGYMHKIWKRALR